jgi:O-antigen ligase
VQTDKNSLGRSSVFDMVTLLMAARLFRRFRVLAYAGAAGAVFLVIGSTSKTSLGALGGLIVFLIVFQAFRGRKTLYGAVATLYVTATVIGIWVGLRSLEIITDILDKDVSLTGRTVLWELVLREVPERLWLGSGFGAFWTDWFGPSHEVWIDFGSRLPHAHNALLEYLLELGVIGAGMFLFVYLRGVARATRYVRAVPGAIGLWPLTMLSFTLLFSLTEVGVQGRNIFWVAFILALLSVARQQKVSAEEGRALRRMRSFGLRPELIDLADDAKVPGSRAAIEQPRKQRV